MDAILDSLSRAFADPGVLGVVLRVLVVVLVAWLVSLVAGRVLPRLIFALGPRKWRRSINSKRLVTLRGLITSVVNWFTFLVALILILEMFIPPATILAVAGLFSFALGMSARPLVSDVFAGVTLLFEDQFAVGEKVELSGVMGMDGVMGTIERIGIRTTHIRADSGELFIVPNGDVRVVRNFSRGTFSLASITVKVRSDHVSEALAMLEAIGFQARNDIPEIVEEPMVISQTGSLGAETELTLKVKTNWGQGAGVRSVLLARAQTEFAEKGIHVVIP
jgi:small conductance mechanosensitive channel